LKDVDVQSTAHELASMALKTVVPHITFYDPDFPWQPDEFIVCDKKWISISSYLGAHPYFYNECLHASKAKNSKVTVFKTMQFNLFVVTPERQWLEYEKSKEECDRLRDSKPANPRAMPDSESLAVACPQAHHHCHRDDIPSSSDFWSPDLPRMSNWTADDIASSTPVSSLCRQHQSHRLLPVPSILPSTSILRVS
jgi:hypothetical protein